MLIDIVGVAVAVFAADDAIANAGVLSWRNTVVIVIVGVAVAVVAAVDAIANMFVFDAASGHSISSPVKSADRPLDIESPTGASSSPSLSPSVIGARR